jgi:8-oxo-dGTP pyrophosphatase MutT (NUDIX family)
MPHIHEKIDFTVEVFIVHKNKVLLRMHDKFHIWLSVGGHIELTEDPTEAAIREVKEEVGLDIIITGELVPSAQGDFKPLLTPKYLCRHYVSDTHEHVCFVYFATSDSDAIVDSVSDHERSDTRWVTKEELEAMNLVPNVKFYAQKALEELSS